MPILLSIQILSDRMESPEFKRIPYSHPIISFPVISFPVVSYLKRIPEKARMVSLMIILFVTV